MIYVSTACVKARHIRDSVSVLAEAGFRNIELSGGTRFYPEYESDLLALQNKYELNYQVHNYFPPPEKPFVINLASLNYEIIENSIKLCKNAINLSRKLGGKYYGIHAGFLIDIKPSETGKKITLKKQSKREKALNRFSEGWKQILDYAAGDIELYIENNGFSKTNSKTYNKSNSFLLTDYQGYLELKKYLDFNLLLDIAHLKVSTNTLGLELDIELEKLFPVSNYIHIGENDGLHDQNNPVLESSLLLKNIRCYNLNDKQITIEVYDKIENLIASYETIRNLIDFNNKEN